MISPTKPRSLVLEAWPEEVAGPISREIHNVLVGAHGQVLTVGVALALYFASSGVESLRIGLNRAYTVVETRSLVAAALESIGYVVLAAVGVAGLVVPGAAGAADLGRPCCAVFRRSSRSATSSPSCGSPPRACC